MEADSGPLLQFKPAGSQIRSRICLRIVPCCARVSAPKFGRHSRTSKFQTLLDVAAETLALGSGAIDFISKPFEAKIVLAKIFARISKRKIAH